MVSSITSELKTQVDGLEELSPTIAPLQDEITTLDATITTLNADIAKMKEAKREYIRRQKAKQEAK